MNVIISDIQRMSSEDGPGLRVTAFFKGCSLRCEWCHNPECIAFKGELIWNEIRCIGCRTCVEVCPNGCLAFEGDILNIDRAKCTACFRCEDACPGAALEGKGKAFTPEKLCRELAKDRAYFGTDGGVTLSGGEALMQPGSVEVLQCLKSRGIQTAVDTCGMVPAETLERALAYTDIVLYDIKVIDNRLHEKLTGCGNRQIFENFDTVCRWAEKGGRLWVRTPVIPGATDSVGNIAAIGALIKSKGAAVERWELCAFNNLCRDKYRRLNIPWKYDETRLISAGEAKRLAAAAEKTRACAHIRLTGATLKEGETNG